MLQLPDFKGKNVVIIRSAKGEAFTNLKLKNENLTLVKDEKIVNQISIHKIFAIFAVGEMSFTTTLTRNLMHNGVSTFFLKPNLETYASIEAEAAGNYVLRQRQYQFKDDLNFAKNLVKNKSYNQLSLLWEKCPEFFKDKTRHTVYKKICQKIDEAKTLNELLGMEGNFTKNYFQAYFEPLKWYKRMPRTKVDTTNLLMDIGYTMLFNFIDSLLRLHGCDTCKGIYHQLFFQRKSLSCDLMEPFRCIIERTILKAHNLGQIETKDFQQYKGKYSLKFDQNKKYMELFLEEIMKEKTEIFSYIKQFYFCILNETQDYPFYKHK